MDELIQQLIDGEIGIEEFRTQATELGIVDVDGLLQALNLSGESIPTEALGDVPTQPGDRPGERRAGDPRGLFAAIPGQLEREARGFPRPPVGPAVQPFIGPPERPTAASRFATVPEGVGEFRTPEGQPFHRTQEQLFPTRRFTSTTQEPGIFSEENQQVLDVPGRTTRFGPSPILSEENIDVLQSEQVGTPTFQRRAALFGGPTEPSDVPGFEEDPSNLNAIFQASLARFNPTPNQANFFQARRADITNQFEALRGQAAFEGRDPSRLSEADFLRDFDFQGAFRAATPTQRRSPDRNVSTPSSAFNPRLRRLN